MAATRWSTLILLLVLGLAAALPAGAQGFIVKDIRLEGLQRISAGTVFNYLPIKVGERVDTQRTAEAIRALFRTGFFKNVSIERQGDVLIVKLKERPSIANITFKGNSEISTKDLLKALKQVNFAPGRVFNRAVFDQVKQELRRAYFDRGKYAVRIKTTVTPLPRNRVSIAFDISEGRVAKIRAINIVGNKAFSDDTLLGLFKLTTPTWFSWFTKSDQYSKQKLAGDLERLRSFYLDHGYVNFNVNSTQVSITPDKRYVYITINITEGHRYRVSDIKLAGKLVVPPKKLFPLIKVYRGEVFSRKAISQTTEAIGDYLGTLGYLFANVNAIPEIDRKNHTVALTFYVDPGRLTYVRRINFKGNSKTRDAVLRREMRQQEGALIDTAAVKRSKDRLEKLGFFSNVTVQTPPVPGTTDEVDVDYSVTETPSGSLMLGAGYGQTQGFIVQTSIQQNNFLGTGNQFGAAFNNSSVNTEYSLSWFNPYWTIDGVSRGFNAYYRTTNALNANLSNYSTNEVGLGLNFGIPVSEFDTVNFGTMYRNTQFRVLTGASTQVQNFAQENGTSFNNYFLTTSWSHDTRNRFYFPDRGGLTRLSAEVTVPGSSLQYYKLTASHEHYFPITGKYTFGLGGEFGYGNGYGHTKELPLIANFYSGGIRSVAGYKDNTIGPLDSNGLPLGGDVKLEGRAQVIMPLPFAENVNSVRLSTFVDTGAVYGPNQSIDLALLRYSVGAAAVWLSPLGALTISLAAPLNKQPGDQTQVFQFTFGTSF